MRFTMNSVLLAAMLVVGAFSQRRDMHNFATTTSVLPNTTEETNAWEIHNELREAVGVPPIIWSNEFTDMAQVTADRLAAHNNLSNYPNHTIYAEQLMYFNPSIDGRGDLVTAADLWALNQPYYNNETIPEGDFDRYHVYTQMVWSNTVYFGMASATAADGGVYVVALYFPKGNIDGEKPYVTNNSA